MERREFLGWVSIGTLATSLPVIIAACSSKSDSEAVNSDPNTTNPVSDNLSNTPGFVAVGTLQDLDQNGVIVDEAAKLVVIREPETNKIIALNSSCTHKGCVVEWKAEGKTFDCPCHGSQFAPNGTVIKSPATLPLATYELKEEKGTILVKL